jgi:hypothetical protein
MRLDSVITGCLCALLLASCAGQPRFRKDAKVLAARGPLERLEGRQDAAARQAVFPDVGFLPDGAPSGRVEFRIADDPDLPSSHGVLRVRFMAQGWEGHDPVITWVRLFDAEGNILAEAHPGDTTNGGKDAISRIRSDAPWHRDAFFDLPKRVAAKATRVEIFLDTFLHQVR